MKQSISKLNKEWHLTHRMPSKATLGQRIAWAYCIIKKIAVALRFLKN